MITNNEFIEIHLDAENKAIGRTSCRCSGLRYTHRFFYLIQNHAPQVLQEHVHIQLSHAQFEQFV